METDLIFICGYRIFHC